MSDGEAPEPTPAVEAPPPPRHLAIDVAGRPHAVPVARVQEVMRVAAITRVPHAPPYVRGLTTLRGRLVPVIDVGAAGQGAQARIVVVTIGARLIGLLVDRVGAVGAPPDDAVILDVDALAGGAA